MPLTRSLAVAAVAGVAGCVCGQTTLLMHYMPWYESPEVRGFWGKHWTGFQDQHDPDQLGPDGLPDIYSNYHPLIGPYDSADPDVLECHLLQMKLAGVDGVIADWYGLSSAADYPLIHEATEALFDAAGAFGLGFAVCFEDRTVEFLVNSGQLAPGQVTGHLSSMFAWMQANWFGEPQYFRRNGVPLVLNFGPVFVQSAGPWDAAINALPTPPDLFGLHNLWTLNGSEGGFTWVHWSAWDGNPSELTIKQRLTAIHSGVSADPNRVIPSAVPGFDDVYPDQFFPFLDHKSGTTLRQSLEAAMEGPWPIVQLVTWNDYGEGTMIEPTHEFGYTFLEVVQNERRQELGGVFPFSPLDLRLPERLFRMRKSGAFADAALDGIAQLIGNGNVAAARDEMDEAFAGLFLTQPSDTVVEAGDTLTLTASVDPAAGATAPRWERDGVPLVDDGRVSGAQTGTLVIGGAVPGDAGVYRLTAVVAGEAIACDPAVVGVRRSPFGPVDFNNDGVVDEADLLEFLAASP